MTVINPEVVKAGMKSIADISEWADMLIGNYEAYHCESAEPRAVAAAKIALLHSVKWNSERIIKKACNIEEKE